MDKDRPGAKSSLGDFVKLDYLNQSKSAGAGRGCGNGLWCPGGGLGAKGKVT
jgi:hypothetical protein